MAENDFISRYQQLQNERPSVVASGFWFLFVWLLARLLFFASFAALVVCFLWALNVLPESKYSFMNESGVKTLVSALVFSTFVASGFAARMARRVVVRNTYIAQLELLVEEELKKGMME